MKFKKSISFLVVLTLVVAFSATCFAMTPTTSNNFLDRCVNSYISGPSVTIVVDQPSKFSNYCIDDGISEVGHTFIRVYDGSNTYYCGFYPKDGISNKDLILNYYADYSILGWVLWNDTQHASDYKWDEARSYSVTAAQAKSVLDWMEYRSHDYRYTYNLKSQNCTTFAVTALSKAGISSGFSAKTWQFSPTASQTLINSQLGKVPNIFGFCPGQLGEDIRNSQQSPSSSVATFIN